MLMRRNLLLVLAFLVSILLIVNSTKRILSFHSTSRGIVEAEARLERLKKENEALKRDLEYKKSDQFTEGEIRNKLGLAKKGEEIVVVPKDESDKQQETSNKKEKANWEKWRELFFGS